MEKIAIINCRKTISKCSGKGCKLAYKKREDAFSDYPQNNVKRIRLIHCPGDCENPKNNLTGVLRRLEKKAVTTIHLSSCMKTVCRNHALYFSELSKKYRVVDYTHGKTE
jgi:predicted metal-binding protein